MDDFTRKRFADGRAFRIFAGSGSGAPCAHCGVLIPATHTEYEVVLPDPSDGTARAGGLALHLHLPCFEIWRRSAFPDP